MEYRNKKMCFFLSPMHQNKKIYPDVDDSWNKTFDKVKQNAKTRIFEND